MKNLFKQFLFFPILLFGLNGFCQKGQLQFTRVDVKNGLSHNQVNCILKDEQGFMWFGTLSGLNRYDGYSFKTFRHKLNDSTSLKDSYITGIFNLPDEKLWINTRSGSNIYHPETETLSGDANAYLRSLNLPNGTINEIVKDANNNFWFIYNNNGVYRYSGTSNKTAHIQYLPNNPSSLSNNRVSAIATDESGNLWIIQKNGILQKLDGKSLKVTYRSDALLETHFGKEMPYKLFLDRQGDLWIYMFGTAGGLFYFDSSSQKFHHITTHSKPFQLNNNIVCAITQDSKGTIWVGTDHGGITLINKQKNTVRYLTHNPEDANSLSQNSIYTLYRDNTGKIWAGTYKKGVCYYNEQFERFPLYSHDPSDINSLPYEDINRFVEDKKGNLWIGTNGGGLIYYDRKNNTYKQYKHVPGNQNSLCNNVIVGLHMDSHDKLWIGTYTGGLDCFDGNTFTHYKHDPLDSTSLSNNSIWDIYEDSQGQLWIGTLGGGLDRFDRKTRTFANYKGFEKVEGISFITVIIEDDKNNLWVGTSYGVEVMDLKTGKSVYFSHNPQNPNSLSNNNINEIFQDSRGWIWIGTRVGLNLYKPKKQELQTFTVLDGLPDNTILSVLEDEQQRMWMGTPRGLSCLKISELSDGYDFSFKNYNEFDGLQGREFNDKSAFKTKGGKLIFGGANGFNMFDPSQIKPNKQIPKIVFTDLQIFNKSVRIGDTIKNRIILPKAISQMENITIPYGANDFSIVFAALGYTQSSENKYAYRLKGFNEQWVFSDDKTHKATYTNLDPGEYTFFVKASNNDGLWSKQTTSIQIEVLPPFWRTTWAYLLYVLLIIGLLYVARNILLYKARMRFQMEHQQVEAQRLHELDMMKIRFFTNISHEFRTPLSLIMSPVEKILSQTADKGQQNQLKLIHRNAKRLLHLVNQLLDFRKMEVQEINLNPVNKDIIRFITEIVHSFTDIAEKKNIRFSLETAIPSLQTDFDTDKLERILFNLLSNAFKFTHENGTIAVGIFLKATQHSNYSELTIQVKDNGIGIPYEKQQRIFERFFQHKLPSSVVNTGSGIGLSITSEFVKLHKGTISVESEVDKGSCFKVVLPIASSKKDYPSQKTHTIPLSINQSSNTDNIQRKNKPTILLIDDNEDFRFYLKDNLSVYFNLLEASNGNEGWDKCITLKPDLIVCDIMMPIMNGIELSKKIKKDARTTNIPVILLTARASEEQKLEGYSTGANDYLTKPFNFEILLARIHNLLAEKKRQQKNLPPKVAINPNELSIISEDEKFLEKVKSLVEKNMNDPDFSVKELSTSLYISRVTLYKKLTSITGKTPIAFIRMMRIKRAAQLLDKGQMTVAQAAYDVGFNNPKYFTRYFKQEFSVLPSEYGKKG